MNLETNKNQIDKLKNIRENVLLNNPGIKEEIKQKIENMLKLIIMKI